MVLGIIMFMGKVSGAHLNPAVSIAFALRRDFPWRRVPGYIIVQLIGATLAALFLHAVINVSAIYGSNYVASGYPRRGFWMELLLTFGLVSVILGTASGAQNIGMFAAFGVGAYIALAGLVGSPISGASMNPATFGLTSSGATSPLRARGWRGRSDVRGRGLPHFPPVVWRGRRLGLRRQDRACFLPRAGAPPQNTHLVCHCTKEVERSRP